MVFPHSCLVLVIAFLNLLYYMVCMFKHSWIFFFFYSSSLTLITRLCSQRSWLSQVSRVVSSAVLLKLFSCQVQAAFYVVTRNVHWGGTSLHLCVEGNLPDPGKTQDFVKKLAQVLEEDEKIRKQLETLVSPSCSCKQAEVCVVSTVLLHLTGKSCFYQRSWSCLSLWLCLHPTERNHQKTGQPQTTQQSFPRDGEVFIGEDSTCSYRHRIHQVH